MNADIADIRTLSTTDIRKEYSRNTIHHALYRGGNHYGTTEDNIVFVTEIWSRSYEKCYYSETCC